MSSSSRPSDLDIQDVLRRRAAEMHQQVDNWLELTLRELGVEQTTEEVAHIVGISFEPSVQLSRLPSEAEAQRVQQGFYKTRTGQRVEVKPSEEAGMVSFEIATDGEVEYCSLDEQLFDLLFTPDEQLAPQALQAKTSETMVWYGLHPLYRHIALRYNADGSITQGRFGLDGEFIAAG